MATSSLRNAALRLHLAACAALAALAPAAAHAEFPDGQPIKIVVGFGPGTGSDLQTRVLLDALSRELGTAVIVDNRPGAAGMVGASAVAAAPPDGHVLAFGTTTSMVTLPLLSKNVKYEALRDFVPIATMGKSPFVVMVPNKPGAPTTLKELIARVQAGKLTYGSIGTGSFGHLGSARLLAAVNAQAIHVPYKSSPQELQDLAAGTLDFVMDSVVAGLPLVRNGLVRPLAVTSSARLASLADVPTVAEVLGTDFEHATWTGLMAPARTPAPIVQKIALAVSRALRDKDVQARYTTMELQPFALDSAGFTGLLKSEVPAWTAFFARTGIHIDE